MVGKPPSLSLTAVVLTLNEELNLPACLKSVEDLCSQIFVVDSGSTDQTVAIAKRHGAQVVHHPFETHAKQWNWALKTLPMEGDWVLALDADHRISASLREELSKILPKTPMEIEGYYLPRKLIFRGKWLRFGGLWPRYFLKLFRRGKAVSDEQELVDHRFYVHGKTRRCQGALLDENLGPYPILLWLKKHTRYIELQAQEEFLFRHGRHPWITRPSLWGTPDQRLLWMRSLWYRLPLYGRSFAYFFYRYVLRFGVLDGAEGALFHFLQGLWFRLMIDIRLSELERARRGKKMRAA